MIDVSQPPSWLWNDLKWIEKRIKEQGRYKNELDRKYNRHFGINVLERNVRYAELDAACYLIYDKFVTRRKELMKQNSEVSDLVKELS